MSHGDQPIVLTDEDGVALGIVCEGELHPSRRVTSTISMAPPRPSGRSCPTWSC